MHFLRVSVLIAVILAATGTLAQDRTSAAGNAVWLNTAAGRLKAVVFQEDASVTGSLIVVLHGDAPFERPGYQYQFAKSAARAAPGATVVAILRPGYTDPAGDSSQGQRGMTTGDNYTPQVIDAISEAVSQLAVLEHSTSVTLVGHSGGAAIAADIMERHPSLASRVLLVSCPCDVKRWRTDMAWKQFNPLWLLPVGSLSPIDRADQLSPRSVIRIVVGESDAVAPPALSRTFATAARKHAARVDLVLLPGLGHEILLRPEVLAALAELQR